MEPKKIIFMGTPDFAVSTLRALHQSFKNTTLIITTKPDKVRGRGRKTEPCPVKIYAQKHNMEIYEPKKKSDVSELVNNHNPDLIIVVAFGMIIPKDVTDNVVCINCHASLLPEYRGPSPIHASLLNNDTQTGITLIKLNEKMDEGDILKTSNVTIRESDNFKTLHDKLAEESAKTLVGFLKNTPNLTSMTMTPQNHTNATYCKLITKDNTYINWDMAPKEFIGKVRAFSPKPGATLIHNNTRVKVLHAQYEEDKITLQTVQPEGKGPMSYSDYCLGHPDGLYPC